jgi:hypothetical protein
MLCTYHIATALGIGLLIKVPTTVPPLECVHMDAFAVESSIGMTAGSGLGTYHVRDVQDLLS